MDWKDLTASDLKTHRHDIYEALVTEGRDSRNEEFEKLTKENQQLQAKVDEQAVIEATREKEAVVDKLLADLPEQARTDTFRKLCLAQETGTDGAFDKAAFEAKVAELVKDRKALCENTGVRGMGSEQKRATKEGEKPKVDGDKFDEAAKLPY